MLKKFILAIGILGLVAIVGFVIWGSTPLGPSAEAVAAAASGNGVQVQATAEGIVFRPEPGEPTTGLIFYPGGRVEPRSYAPLLRQIAAQGFLVVLVPMPLNLAVFGSDKASQVIQAFPQVKTWAIGGHSLGGSMAAQFAIDHPGQVSGLFFWASYPPSAMDQRGDLQFLSISASLDGLATPATIENNRHLLPSTTHYVMIEGGDHAQFGSYGPQPGDNPASIAPAVQWEKTVQATVGLLQSITRK